MQRTSALVTNIWGGKYQVLYYLIVFLYLQRLFVCNLFSSIYCLRHFSLELFLTHSFFLRLSPSLLFSLPLFYFLFLFFLATYQIVIVAHAHTHTETYFTYSIVSLQLSHSPSICFLFKHVIFHIFLLSYTTLFNFLSITQN